MLGTYHETFRRQDNTLIAPHAAIHAFSSETSMTLHRQFLCDLDSYISLDEMKRLVNKRAIRVLEMTIARRLHRGQYPDTLVEFREKNSRYAMTRETIDRIQDWPDEERIRIDDELGGSKSV